MMSPRFKAELTISMLATLVFTSVLCVVLDHVSVAPTSSSDVLNYLICMISVNALYVAIKTKNERLYMSSIPTAYTDLMRAQMSQSRRRSQMMRAPEQRMYHFSDNDYSEETTMTFKMPPLPREGNVIYADFNKPRKLRVVVDPQEVS